MSASIVGLLVALAMLPLIYAFNYYSLGFRTEAARASVQQAFASGELTDDSYLPGDTDRGFHQFNDCLILFQSLDQAAPRQALAVSPLGTLDEPCKHLRTLATTGTPPPAFLYHRYIHGHTMLARYMLPFLSVSRLRLAWKTLTTILIVAGVGLALVNVARAREPSFDHLFWLVTFASFSRWFGLETVGQSLGHGPADATLIAFMLFLYGARCLGGLPPRFVAPIAGVFGVLTMVFEFLTGGIPLGWAVLAGALPFALSPHLNARRAAPLVVAALVSFSVAILTVALGKLWLVWHVFGLEGVHNITTELAARTGLGPGIEPVDASPAGLAKVIWLAAGSLSVGMRSMGLFALVGAILCGLWGFLQLRHSSDEGKRTRARLLAMSNLMLVLWIAVFSQHFLVHYRFMGRILVWPIASGFALFALALWQRATARVSPPIAVPS